LSTDGDYLFDIMNPKTIKIRAFIGSFLIYKNTTDKRIPG
jgi:hypothetical protein